MASLLGACLLLVEENELNRELASELLDLGAQPTQNSAVELHTL